MYDDVPCPTCFSQTQNRCKTFMGKLWAGTHEARRRLHWEKNYRDR